MSIEIRAADSASAAILVSPPLWSVTLMAQAGKEKALPPL
jgi:hypothetical protein